MAAGAILHYWPGPRHGRSTCGVRFDDVDDDSGDDDGGGGGGGGGGYDCDGNGGFCLQGATEIII